MGGGGSASEASDRLGMPIELAAAAEQFEECDEIYQDNVQIVTIFSDMATQWRVGPGGPIGMDYLSLPVVMKFRRVPEDDEEDIFSGIKIMERAALEYMRESR